MRSQDASSGSNGRHPTDELGELIQHGDFGSGRRDSQVNIVLQNRRSNSLRPSGTRRTWLVISALAGGLIALTAAIWKLVDVIKVLLQ